jgi:hypothetical protein
MLAKLLEKQENRNNSHLRRSLNSVTNIKDSKEAKYYKYDLHKYENKAIYSTILSLKYLCLGDHPESLLLLSKLFNQKLKNKIAKFYLLNSTILYSDKTENIRNKLIMNYFKLKKCEIDYISMKI